MKRSHFIASILGLFSMPFFKKSQAMVPIDEHVYFPVTFDGLRKIYINGIQYSKSKDGVNWTKAKPEEVNHLESVKWAEENGVCTIVKEENQWIEVMRNGKWDKKALDACRESGRANVKNLDL